MESQISIRLPDDLLDRIDRKARGAKSSRSQLIRSLLEQALEGKVAEESVPYARVRDLVGSVGGPKRDLGTNHRKDLLAAIKDRRG